jgi:hypothetical protein
VTQPAPSYVGERVQIGTGKAGMKPLAQSGRVVLVDGTLQLFDSQQKVLDEGPLDAVTVARGKGLTAGITWVTIGEKRYSLAIGAGGKMLFTGILRVFISAGGGKKLLAAVEAAKA